MKRFVVSLGVVGVLLTASSAMAQRGPACMTVHAMCRPTGQGYGCLIGIAKRCQTLNSASSRRRRSKASPQRLMHVAAST